MYSKKYVMICIFIYVCCVCVCLDTASSSIQRPNSPTGHASIDDSFHTPPRSSLGREIKDIESGASIAEPKKIYDVRTGISAKDADVAVTTDNWYKAVRSATKYSDDDIDIGPVRPRAAVTAARAEAAAELVFLPILCLLF